MTTTKPTDADLELTAHTLQRLADARRARSTWATTAAMRLPDGDPLRRTYSLAANSAHTEAADLEEAAALVRREKSDAAARS